MAATTPRKPNRKPSVKKDDLVPDSPTPGEDQDLPQYNLSLVIHMDNNQTRIVDLGKTNQNGINQTHLTIDGAFDTHGKSHDLFLIDVNGSAVHYNIQKIVCIEVRIDPAA